VTQERHANTKTRSRTENQKIKNKKK